jgi:hypothetical protein
MALAIRIDSKDFPDIRSSVMAASHRDPSTSKPSLTAAPVKVSALQEAIRARAEEIYERNGRVPGRDVQNWTQAEAEVMQEWSERAVVGRTAVVVNVNGVEYIGEYSPDHADGYRPGEFDRGQPVPIRFADGKMFVTRPNGTELETILINHSA